jgi:S1-C subfamily serine protease
VTPPGGRPTATKGDDTVAFRLIGQAGERRGEAIEVLAPRFLIGRDDSCDLMLSDVKASRRHAAIETLASGQVVLSDLGSANGTFLNGKRLEDNVTLRGGEILRIGDTEFRVDAQSAGETVLATTPPTRMRSGRRPLLVGAGIVAVVVVIGIVLAVAGVFGGDDDPMTVPEIVAAAGPSTLPVSATHRNSRVATGSGWVYDGDRGLVVTNAHVIDGGSSFTVGLGANESAARVVASAPCEDLALLRAADARGLVTLPLGSMDELVQGDTVVALGYPRNASGLDELTATRGVVSALDTTFNDPPPSIPELPSLIRTDAAINPGNSGGPLLDERARLVGVNTIGSRGTQDEGYAISVDRVEDVLATLSQGRSIGWTGMGFYELGGGRYGATIAEEIAFLTAYFGLSPAQGLVVDQAVPETSAAGRGIGEDGPLLLTSVEGSRVRTMNEYCQAVQGLETGDRVRFTFVGEAGVFGDRAIRRVPMTME